MTYALGFRSFPAALSFFTGWPDQARAAQLVLARASEIDGNLYHLLDPAARLIEGRDAQSVPEIAEEREAELAAGLHQAEQGVAGGAPTLAHGAAADLALG